MCSVSGATVTLSQAGTCVINANQAGNDHYQAAPQAQQKIAVIKQSQAVSFDTQPGAVFNGDTYDVAATATSKEPVAITIDPSTASVCSISGATVDFHTSGTCIIDADQAGNDLYQPAPQVRQVIEVGFHEP